MRNIFTISSIVNRFKRNILLTWMLVICEFLIMILTPFLIGKSIDDLLIGKYESFYILGGSLFLLILLSVLRRVFDTRAYGNVFVWLAQEVIKRHSNENVSKQNARLEMSKGLIDFLEETLPEVISSFLQVIISACFLYYYSPNLGLGALLILVLIVAIYLLFHKRFYQLYELKNNQAEKQINILEKYDKKSLFEHLNIVRNINVRISDSEGGLYGIVFSLQIAYSLYCLWFSTEKMNLSTGAIFTIVTYSWEFVESSIVLPITMQELSKLEEIKDRLN